MLSRHLAQQSGRAGAFVHLGAGAGGETDAAVAAGFDPVVLVEADPALLPRLTAAAPRGVTVHHAAIVAGRGADGDGQVPFNVLNVPDFSTLCDPAPLRALLPGVRTVDRPAVPALTIEALCAGIPALGQDDRAHWLVIETAGIEAALLEALRTGGWLARFDRIAVSAPARDLFGTGGHAAIAAVLEPESYRLEETLAEDDPDWPTQLYRRDVAAIEARGLAGRLAQAEALLDRERVRHAGTRDRAGQAETRAADAEAEIRRLRDELATALRLQAMARDDHRDLQRRFETLQADKARQEQLILKLTDRLRSAADYLRLLPGQEEPSRAAKIASDDRTPDPPFATIPDVSGVTSARRKKRKK